MCWLSGSHRAIVLDERTLDERWGRSYLDQKHQRSVGTDRMLCVRKEKVPPVSGKQKAALCAQSLVPCTISPSGLLKDNLFICSWAALGPCCRAPASSDCSTRAFHRGDVSRWGVWALECSSFSSCDSWALGHRLSSCGPRA